MGKIALVTGRGTAPNHAWQLFEELLPALYRACDQADFETARQLIDVLDVVASRPFVLPVEWDRHFKDTIIAVYERFWYLRWLARNNHLEVGISMQTG